MDKDKEASQPVGEPAPDSSAAAGGAKAGRYRHTTPYYDLVILTSPARIEQLAVDPSGRGHYVGLLNNFGPKGSSVFASYGSRLMSGKEEAIFEAGRPKRALESKAQLRLEGVPVGPHGLAVDWTFIFSERTFDMVLDWHVFRPQVDLCEAGWKLDGISRHIGDATCRDLPARDRGPYRDASDAYLLWWENDPRYAHTLVTAYVPGTADRGDNVVVAPNLDRPVTWGAWLTICAPDGTTLGTGHVKAGRWRFGFSGRAADCAYARALSSEVAHGPDAVPDPGSTDAWSGQQAAIAWAQRLGMPTDHRGKAQVSRGPDSSWTLTDGRVLAALVPTEGRLYKAWWYVATDETWQLAATSGPTQRINAVAPDSDGAALMVQAEGLGPDGQARTVTDERWTIRSDPSRIHIESTDTPINGARAHPMHTVLAYPNGMNKHESGGYDMLVSPHLRPQADLVIGQHSMRSPVLAVQKGAAYVALIPDLLYHRTHGNYGPESSPAHFAPSLDFDIANRLVDAPLLGFGWRNTEWVYSVYGVEEGYYCRDRGETAPSQPVQVAYDLLLRTNASEYSVVSDTQKFLWAYVGHRYFEQSRLPQTQPADHAFVETWSLWEDRYDTRIVDGRLCGAVRTDREFPPDVMFMSWFNALRTSYGLYSQGRQQGNEELMAKGEATLNLLLSAPTQNGAFPTIAGFRPHGFEWFASHKNFANQMYWGPTSFNTFDMSWAAYWVLRWYEDLVPDERAVTFARSYGGFLLDQQLPSGAIPSWIAQGNLSIDPHLRESAQTAASVLFLAELVRATGEDRYLVAAQHAGRFIVQECLFAQRWDDYEVYYSNVPKSEGATDPISGQSAQNTLSMHFAAAGFLTLFQLTGDRMWLVNGERILDYALQYQAVWPAPFLSQYTYGGFSAQNTDQEWLDARQSQVGITLLDYARETGRSDYAERGIVALRSAYATMASPSAEIINPRYFDHFVTGSGNENYAHNPYDLPTTPVPTPHFDWGTGAAAAGFAEARNRFGDIWVDGQRGKAYGIDNVYVESMILHDDSLSLQISSPSPTHLVTLKVEGLQSEHIRLRVNEGPERHIDRATLAHGLTFPTQQAVRIIHNPTRTEPVLAGQAFTVAAAISANEPIEVATVHYRSKNGPWTQAAMAPLGKTQWVGTIPGTSIVRGKRLEYYLTAATASATGQAPEVDAPDVPFCQEPTGGCE